MLFSAANYISINKQTDKVVLLPLGAIEQHGPHLAVSTDTDIVSAIALLLVVMSEFVPRSSDNGKPNASC